MKDKKNVITLVVAVLLFATSLYLNGLTEQRKNTKNLKTYLLMHNYYYDSFTKIYKRNNLPLYSLNPNENTYELDAYAKGLNIYVKYNYKSKQSIIEYDNSGKKYIAYYNHKTDKFTCTDSKEICDIVSYFPKNAHSEFSKILEIVDGKANNINSKYL